MIRCVRIWTGDDGDSHFEEGIIALSAGDSSDSITATIGANETFFQETKAGGSSSWHHDPKPRLVITLSGVLQFETRSGKSFIIRPGDVLLAQDDIGSGHRWKLIGDDPWRRVYVVYQEGTTLPFQALPNP